MRMMTLCEYLSADQAWTEPYFDTESYQNARLSDEAIKAIKERGLVRVDRVVYDQEGYTQGQP